MRGSEHTARGCVGRERREKRCGERGGRWEVGRWRRRRRTVDEHSDRSDGRDEGGGRVAVRQQVEGLSRDHGRQPGPPDGILRKLDVGASGCTRTRTRTHTHTHTHTHDAVVESVLVSFWERRETGRGRCARGNGRCVAAVSDSQQTASAQLGSGCCCWSGALVLLVLLLLRQHTPSACLSACLWAYFCRLRPIGMTVFAPIAIATPISICEQWHGGSKNVSQVIVRSCVMLSGVGRRHVADLMGDLRALAAARAGRRAVEPCVAGPGLRRQRLRHRPRAVLALGEYTHPLGSFDAQGKAQSLIDALPAAVEPPPPFILVQGTCLRQCAD